MRKFIDFLQEMEPVVKIVLENFPSNDLLLEIFINDELRTDFVLSNFDHIFGITEALKKWNFPCSDRVGSAISARNTTAVGRLHEEINAWTKSDEMSGILFKLREWIFSENVEYCPDLMKLTSEAANKYAKNFIGLVSESVSAWIASLSNWRNSTVSICPVRMFEKSCRFKVGDVSYCEFDAKQTPVGMEISGLSGMEEAIPSVQTDVMNLIERLQKPFRAQAIAYLIVKDEDLAIYEGIRRRLAMGLVEAIPGSAEISENRTTTEGSKAIKARIQTNLLSEEINLLWISNHEESE